MTDSHNPLTPNFKNNSDRAKQEGETTRIVAPVVSQPATQKKRSIASKFRESFTGDDAKSVGSYLVFDVIVPSIKDMLFAMIVEGGRRSLFGGSGKPSSSNPIMGRITPYGQMFQSNNNPTVLSGGASTPSALARPVRDTFEYQEVIFASRPDAEKVVDGLRVLVSEYGSATVSDLFSLSGISGNHTAIKWGWNSLTGLEVQPTASGYLLRMPPVVPMQ